MYRKILIIFLISFVSSAQAKEFNCTPLSLKTHDKTITLPGTDNKENPLVYLIKNTSDKSVWIDHPLQHRSASAGWSSFLRAGNWSALLVNRKDFSISCSTIQPGKVNYLSCQDIISVCTAEVLSSSSKKGTYWLAEDKSTEELTKALKKRGVELKN